MTTRTKRPRVTRRALEQVFTSGEKALLPYVKFRALNLEDVDFRGANLSGARFDDVSLAGCDFQDADLRGVRFRNCDLRRAKFAGAALSRNRFDGSWLTGATGLSKVGRAYVVEKGGSFLRTVVLTR